MPAPVYGSSYMVIAPPLTGNPANVAETTNLDAAFETAWNQVQHMCPVNEDGDYAFKIWVANVAYRYKQGGAFVPTISSISPTTGPKLLATPITITGTNFDPNAVVVFGGVDVPSAAHSLTTITFTIPAGLIPVAGTYGVQVRNTDGTITAATNFTAT